MKILILDENPSSYAAPFDNHEVFVIPATKFLNNGYKLSDYGAVHFTGGMDIGPRFYDEPRHPLTEDWDHGRDSAEIGLFNRASERGIPMFGVCRGMQLLNICNGGKLYQDMYHPRNHPIELFDGRVIQVNSLHHQACILSGQTKVIKLGMVRTPDQEHDIEVAWWPDTKSLGFQYHPEMMAPDTEGYKFYFEMLNKYIGEV